MEHRNYFEVTTLLLIFVSCNIIYTFGHPTQAVPVSDSTDKPRKLVGTFNRLIPRDSCIISSCFDNDFKRDKYMDLCFPGTCSNHCFHCLKEPSGTVLFFAEFQPCKMRTQHVADLSDPEYVKVYEQQCELGYMQRNELYRCFEPCDKDTGVEIYMGDKVHGPLLYCNVEYGCNKFGEMFFKQGSEFDNCSGTSTCLPSEDLLPDCRCDMKCPADSERLPENKFGCTPRKHTDNGQSTDAMATPGKIPDEKRDLDNSQDLDEKKDEVDLNEDSTKTADSDSSPSNVFAALLLIMVLIPVIVGIIFFVVKRRSSPSRGGDSAGGNSSKGGNTPLIGGSDRRRRGSEHSGNGAANGGGATNGGDPSEGKNRGDVNTPLIGGSDQRGQGSEHSGNGAANGGSATNGNNVKMESCTINNHYGDNYFNWPSKSVTGSEPEESDHVEIPPPPFGVSETGLEMDDLKEDQDMTNGTDSHHSATELKQAVYELSSHRY